MSTAQIPLNELENADRIWHLQQSVLTDGLSLKELYVMASRFEDRIYRKDATIFLQSSPGDAVYFLNRGAIRLFVSTPGGREKVVGVLKNGALFGEESIEDGCSHPYQAIAHQESWISVISRESFLELLAAISRLSLNLARILSQKLIEAHNEIESLSFSDTELRIARTLIKLSEEHGHPIFGQALTRLKISISHEHLAQLIGANRPHVSSIMSRFKKGGLIDYQKRKLLLNVGGLRKHIKTAS